MSQAEKLIHELEHKCGIDFKNARRPLAVQIIQSHFEQVLIDSVSKLGNTCVVGYEGYEAVLPVMRQDVAIDAVGEAIQESSDATGK